LKTLEFVQKASNMRFVWYIQMSEKTCFLGTSPVQRYKS